MRLEARAPGKVNLCLFVGPRRDDGRHDVVTLLESVSLADELSLRARDVAGPDEVRCRGVGEPNIVSRALEGLRARGWNGPPMTVEIAKRVPVAAGMGGGSADAAATLRLAHHFAAVADVDLQELAAELGSDVPSQLRPGLAIGTGAGDRVERREPLAPHALVIAPLPHQLRTADVYTEADRLGLTRTDIDLERIHEQLTAALTPGAQLPGELIVNDLERAAISLCPSIADARSALLQVGADHALVSGSGPTVFGLFWGPDAHVRAEAAAKSVSHEVSGAASALAVSPDFGHPRLPAQSDD
jgi:4-diphosphocytidyl-2-C-methyl-D-erythritol kinase